MWGKGAIGGLAGLLVAATAAQAATPDIGRVRALRHDGRLTIAVPITHHAPSRDMGEIAVRAVARRPGGPRVVARHRAAVLGAPAGHPRATHTVRLHLTRRQASRLRRAARARAAGMQGPATGAPLRIRVSARQDFGTLSPAATATQSVTPVTPAPGAFPELASEYSDGTSWLWVGTDPQNRSYVGQIATPVDGVRTYWELLAPSPVGTEAVIAYQPDENPNGLWFQGAGPWFNTAHTVASTPSAGTISGLFALDGSTVQVSWPQAGGFVNVPPMPAGALTLPAFRDT